MRLFLSQLGWVGRRSLTVVFRQPATFIPSLIFPLFFLVFMGAGLKSAARLPGFPAPDYVSFALAGALTQGVMFAGLTTGSAIGTDIKTGFINRISLTPIRPSTLVLGHLFGTLGIAVLQVIVYLAYGLIVGVNIVTGFGGILGVAAIALLLASTFGIVAAALGARTGSPEAVEAMFPMFFVFITFSSFFLPRHLLGTRWFKTIADWNPITYFIEAMRALIIEGWDMPKIFLTLSFVVAIGVLGLTAASRSLRSRLARS